MAIFDVYVKKVGQYVEQMRAGGRQVREFDCPTDVSRLVEGLPVRVGPQASSGIILRSDAAVELGSPDAGSSAFVLWTDNPSLIRDGRITLIGPDIQETMGASLPFGQVLVAGGVGLGKEEHAVLEQNQYISDQIQGYMVRSVPQRIWSRVGRDAVAQGFSFETLGRALMAIYKSNAAKVQAVQVVFVTSSKEDVQYLEQIGAQVRKIGGDISRETWKTRGYDILECTLGWDCKACPDKSVCDDIRELIAVRKKGRS